MKHACSSSELSFAAFSIPHQDYSRTTSFLPALVDDAHYLEKADFFRPVEAHDLCHQSTSSHFHSVSLCGE